MQQRAISYLKENIQKDMSLRDMIHVFREMTTIPMEEDMFLFETGTYDFTGEPLFYFSLVRQNPNEDEEFMQIHLDVLYLPSEANSVYQESFWEEDDVENFFSYVLESEAFQTVSQENIYKVEIYLDET